MLRACLLTPRGRGAIATVSVVGDAAAQTVDRLFSSATNRNVDQAEIGRILFGRWHGARKTELLEESTGEELVVCRTEVDRVEIHCHGGVAAAEHVLGSLEHEGCVVLDWPAWVANEMDPISAAAIVALARTTTEQCAAILLDQFNGALSIELKQIAELLPSTFQDAIARLKRLLEFADLGCHLHEPWRVAFVGPPNVGKSSLINTIVGYDRSIVFDQPGTTRDVVTVRTILDGWPVELSDTAGLREVDDPLESAGVERAKRQISEADLVVIVRDIRDRQAISVPSSNAQIMHVANKCDLVNTIDIPPDTIATSATSRIGIDRLIDRMSKLLVPKVPPAGSPVPFMMEHRQAIERSLSLISDGDILAARETLLNIVGQRLGSTDAW